MADLLPDPVALTAFIVASIVIALVPGPDMMLYLSKTIGQSRRAGLVTFAGTVTGACGHIAAATLGLSAVLAASATAFTILKIVGAAYLLYLAWDAIRHGSSFRVEPGQTAESYRSLYLKGFLVDLLNPKMIVFFVTFLPQFITPGDPNATERLLVLGITFLIITTPICLIQIFAASAIANFLRRSPRATRAVDYVFAGIMAAFAVRLVLGEAR